MPGSADPRILELDRGMPWQEPVFSHGLDVLYAVYPVPGGNWMIGAMPPERNSFAQRLPLPAAWAGLQDEALRAASGIEDAVFVHAKRFVASARSRAGAMAMAQAAIRFSLRKPKPTDDNPASISCGTDTGVTFPDLSGPQPTDRPGRTDEAAHRWRQGQLNLTHYPPQAPPSAPATLPHPRRSLRRNPGSLRRCCGHRGMGTARGSGCRGGGARRRCPA